MVTSKINLEHPFIVCLHRAVRWAYNDATLREITGIADTPSKKLVVFLLHKLYGYDPRDIAGPYLIGVDNIPRASQLCAHLYAMSANFQKKVHDILDYVEMHYDENNNQI